MAINYPPYIEGKLPAQYGMVLNIPFQLNRATGITEVQKDNLILRLKTISTNKVIAEISANDLIFGTNDIHTAKFELTDLKLQIGQFYKAQLGMTGSGATYYSTIGTFKYTVKPSVTIEGLDPTAVEQGRAIYQGIYSAREAVNISDANEIIYNTDSSEKVYEYRFDLYSGDTLIETSGRLLHDSRKDTDALTSSNTYSFRTEFLDNAYYQVVYTVYTNNNLTISSPAYYVRKPIEYDSIYDFNINTIPNHDEGYISLSIQSLKQASLLHVAGDFRLCRASAQDDYKYWDEIDSFTLDTYLDTTKPLWIYNDNTVQQGIAYKYAFYQFDKNTGLITKKIRSDTEVIVNFDDIFLSDGERQLKIQFNPKVSSFKNTLLEQKMDTLGGKFPFVFRNGNTNYKEISISGLISLLMDENHLFYKGFNQALTNIRKSTESKEQLLPMIDRQTNLSSENFTNERIFKLEVLAWLTNGEPKLFRSPAEGNYIVRLMNTSLSPNDTLGRMLHTFTSTGYEFAETTFENLNKYGFIRPVEDKIDAMHYQYINLDNYQTYTAVEVINAISVKIHNATERATFIFTLKQGQSIPITIGRVGTYEFPVDVNNPVVKVEFDPKNRGIVELGSIGKINYNITIQHERKKLSKISYAERCAQFVSKKESTLDIIKEIIPNEDNALAWKEIKLDNIVVLRIQTRDDDDKGNNKEYTITWDNGVSNTFDMSKTENLTNIYQGVNLEAHSEGYIEYHLTNTFNSFRPKEITIGDGLIADIFYSVIEYEYEPID